MNHAETKRSGRLNLVGIGPGDPELVTLKAIRILEDADAIVAPMASARGTSNALETARSVVDLSEKEMVQVHFPMKKVHLSEKKHQDVRAGWDKAAEQVMKRLSQGMNVAFPTIGDPSLYSTAYYLLATLKQKNPDLEARIIPGISAMSSCSCLVHSPLALGDDLFCVIPATFDDQRIEEALLRFDSITLMKVHSCLARIVAILERTGLLEKAILVERCGLQGERIFPDVRDALNQKIHYFSTILVRKRGLEILQERIP
ncbi:MAG: precorrin-2 C(20)-methyltransferase [Thermodesulfatator sp.]|nr:MAG: precorrin-2 C(20)-methyltransferase [Thermodesulfatator sp.]